MTASPQSVPAPDAKNRRFSLWGFYRLVVFFGAIAALVWLLDRIGWSAVADSLVRVGWDGAFLLVFLGLCESALDAAALRASSGTPVSPLRILSISGAGAIVNLVIPWEAGEVVKGTLLREHMPSGEAVSATVIWNYLFKVTRPAVALLAALLALAGGAEVPFEITGLILVACMLAFAPYVFLRFMIRKGIASTAVRLVKLAKLLRRDPAALQESARTLDARIRRFHAESPGRYYLVLVFQSLARVCSWLSWYAAFRLVGLDYSFWLCSLIYAGTSVAGYVTMLVPARLGVSEGTWYLLFMWMGLDPAKGLTAVIALRLKMILCDGVPALFVGLGRQPKALPASQGDGAKPGT